MLLDMVIQGGVSASHFVDEVTKKVPRVKAVLKQGNHTEPRNGGNVTNPATTSRFIHV